MRFIVIETEIRDVVSNLPSALAAARSDSPNSMKDIPAAKATRRGRRVVGFGVEDSGMSRAGTSAVPLMSA